jgi:hypothetical protein
LLTRVLRKKALRDGLFLLAFNAHAAAGDVVRRQIIVVQ